MFFQMRSFWACHDTDNMWQDTEESRVTNAAFREFFKAAYNESRPKDWATVHKDGLTRHMITTVSSLWDAMTINFT